MCSSDLYGAVEGGTVSNTEAFRKAMKAATVHGGRVIVPEGIWLTGPIELLSNIELHLAENAVVIFDKNPEEYPLIVTDYEGIRRIRTVSQIWAEHAENIAITGNGTMDGNGHLWRPVKQFKMTSRQWEELLQKSPYVIEGKNQEGGIWVPTKSIYDGRYYGEVFPDHEGALEEAAPYYDFYRPVMVSFRHCRNVLIDGVTIQNSAAWGIHPYFCTDVTVRNMTFYNPYYAQNGDGIDVDSCHNVEIHHCRFNAGDDGICIKSGKDREARKIVGPSENIYIHHCQVGYSHGGFVVGSEMSRGVRHVYVEDCTFINSDVGIRFKSAIGRGGVVEDVYMRRINMVNIKEEAIVLSMDYVHNLMDYNDDVVQTDDPDDIPEFRNIYFEQCKCIGAREPVKIEGLKGYDTIHNVQVNECSFDGMKY